MNYNKSNFCSKPKVKSVFETLIENISSKFIIISYNNEGLLDFETLKNACVKKGDVVLYKIKYNKFKAQKSVKKKFVEEYLWFIKVDNEYEDNNFEEIEAEYE